MSNTLFEKEWQIEDSCYGEAFTMRRVNLEKQYRNSSPENPSNTKIKQWSDNLQYEPEQISVSWRHPIVYEHTKRTMLCNSGVFVHEISKQMSVVDSSNIVMLERIFAGLTLLVLPVLPYDVTFFLFALGAMVYSVADAIQNKTTVIISLLKNIAICTGILFVIGWFEIYLMHAFKDFYTGGAFRLVALMSLTAYFLSRLIKPTFFTILKFRDDDTYQAVCRIVSYSKKEIGNLGKRKK